MTRLRQRVLKGSSKMRMRRFRSEKLFLLPLLSILALIGPSLAGVASAGVNTWTTNGPAGGDTRALAIDPANPATLYAGTAGGGVFKSIDGGGNWNAVDTGLTNPGVVALAIDPSAPATLYAAGTLPGGLFKTTNGGGSWTAINVGMADITFFALAIDPVTPATIYAGTDRGVFKTTNGGESWTATNTGLTRDGFPNAFVLALIVDPSAPATLYASSPFESGVYKSTNGGASWTISAFTVGNNSSVFALAIDPKAPSNIYAGTVSDGESNFLFGDLFRSTDGGAHWGADGLNHDVFALGIAPSTPAALYVATGNGVYKSTGRGWTQSLNRLGYALAIDPSAPATLYAGTSDGVFKSLSAGGIWTGFDTGLIASNVNALAIDPSAPATLYAGTIEGVFKSIDSGGSWTAKSAGLDVTFVGALAIDPHSPATLYAATEGGGVFKSIDGAESWTAINAGLDSPYVTLLAIDPSSPATLYAGVDSGGGVFKSTNGGGSWTAVNTGLTLDRLLALVIDPSAPATLYAAGDGIFKSTDGGGSWNAVNTDLGVYSLAIDPSAPGTLYAGTFPGVYKSIDGGQSWTQMNAGIPNAFVPALIVDPSAPNTLYAAADRFGVFKSTDAGSTWTALNAGLRNPRVNVLAIDPAATRLYAGTFGGGVFDYEDASCVPGPTTLCLSGGRFKVTTQWTTAGQSGSGQAVALSGGDTGYFTFFNPASVEVAVKVLNGCAVNGSYWVFAGGLTNVGVVMTVTDSQTGDVKTYTNAPGTPFQPIQDTNAFAACAAGSTEGARPYDGKVASSLLPPGVSESFAARVTGPCVADATTLCVSSSRYQVRAQWITPDGNSGAGQVIHLTSDTGAFWFFSPNNVEVVVKVLNGCGLNSRYWTFAGGLTNVNVILTVSDTQTGTIQTYTNPQGIPFAPIQDTGAFATCP